MMNKTEKGEDSVSTVFAGPLSALRRCADDIQLLCAEAVIEGNLERSGELLDASRNIRRIEHEVEELSGCLSQKPPCVAHGGRCHTSDNGRLGAPDSKSRRTRLSATVAGQMFDQDTGAENFAAALERMGLDRVSRLGKRCSGIALVSHQATTGYQGQIKKGDWFITTHASNRNKQRMLEDIGRVLGIPVAVRIDA